MKTLAILGDRPTACTGFAVVLNNLANELSKYFRVIYFGRFGQEREFAKETSLIPGHIFEYVPCQGGVWDEQLVVRLLKHYDEIDYVLSEDDWFSAQGMLQASIFCDKPFHLITPIDSLPVSDNAWYNVFTNCDKIYVPNSSYELYNGRKRESHVITEVKERSGDFLKSIYLPHGVDTDLFQPIRVKRNNEFTFLWSGRIEQRKAPGRTLLAFEKICDKVDARIIFRSDWNSPNGERFLQYMLRKNLPVDLEQMSAVKDLPHGDMALLYSKADVNLCSSMAGGFEMGVTEAAACQVSSIVTDWTFMNENVVHNKSGWVVPTSGSIYPDMRGRTSGVHNRIWGEISIDALADRMLWCYMNQLEVRRAGIWAREYVKETYHWPTIAKKLKDEILE